MVAVAGTDHVNRMGDRGAQAASQLGTLSEDEVWI